MKKYELTNQTKIVKDKILYRIKALKDFADVKAGDLGGFVQGEHNLSQEGNCWVYDEAYVFDNAIVFGNAKIQGFASVSDNAKIYDEASVFEKAMIDGNASVFGNGKVSGFALVTGNVKIYENAWVFQSTFIYENAEICGNAWVYGSASANNNVFICDDAKVSGAIVTGNSYICDNACLKSTYDYFYGEDYYGTFITFFKSKDNTIKVRYSIMNDENGEGETFIDTLENFKAFVKTIKHVNQAEYLKLLIKLVELKMNR